MDIVVNGRLYREVELAPPSKLEHLHEEAHHEARRLEESLPRQSPRRQEYWTRPILERVRAAHSTLGALLDESLDRFETE